MIMQPVGFMRAAAAATPVDVAPHNMTAGNLPTPYVVLASSSYGSAWQPWQPWRAFDGLKGTYDYWTAGESTGWLQIDLGAGNAKTLHNYSLANSTVPTPTYCPKDWTMQGSNDGTNWTVLDTVTGQTAWGNGEVRNFVCDVTTTAYRYFRVNATANNGDVYLVIAEVYLFAV